MIIKLEHSTITGWINNRSQDKNDHDEFTIHARMIKGSSFQDGYDSSYDESYATWGEAEYALLKRCYEIAENHLLVSDVPF